MLIKTAASTATKKYSSIGIIGGGIGGLTVANALLNKNNLVDKISIYDQATEFVPYAGAGFGFSPNGQICFHSIGITNFDHLGHQFDVMSRIDKTGQHVRVESNVLEELRMKHGFGISGFLRADVVDILVDRLTNHYNQQLHYGHKLIKITNVKDKVEVEFENGHQDVFDLVIGADGINSTVAKQLQIDDTIPPIYAKANIFYGKIHQPDDLSYFQSTQLFKPHTIVNGPGTGEYLNFFCGSGSKKTFIWVNTYSSKSPPQRQLDPDNTTEEWNKMGNKQELYDTILPKYTENHPVHDLADLTPSDNILHFGLYYRHHKKTWTNNDRVVLLGDACHATLPYVGQGANQAIEDSIFLADCLYNHPTYTQAFQDYYDVRFPRTKRVVQIANILNRLYHTEYYLLQQIREKILDSAVQGGMIFKQMESEILNDCPVKNYQQYVSSTKD